VRIILTFVFVTACLAQGIPFPGIAVSSAAPAVDTPTDSPGQGTYSSAQTVTLGDTTGSATICYTTDGSTPAAATPGTCSTGTTYSTGFNVAATTTVKAIGTKAGMTNSAVMSSVYTISSSPGIHYLTSTAERNGGTVYSVTTLTGIDTTGASLLVAVLNLNNNYDPSSAAITDKLAGTPTSNNWHHLTSQIVPTLSTTVIWYAYDSGAGAPLQVGANHTFIGTYASNPGAYSIAVAAYSGTLASGDPYDGNQNGAQNTAANPSLSTGSITPSVDGCLIISGMAARSQASPYTSTLATLDRTGTWVSATYTGIGMAHSIQTGKTAVSSTWSWTSGIGQMAVTIAAFKPQ
jgi:hypothetical protein